MTRTENISTRRCHIWLTLLTTILAWAMAMPSHAVLKERDLGKTLGVLRKELTQNYEKQRSFLMRYERTSEDQHNQLVEYMKRSEQISLILYSQKTDFTFDVAYACQQATDLHRQLKQNNMPYEDIRNRVLAEVARYDSLINALEALPPALVHYKDGQTEAVIAKEDSTESHLHSLDCGHDEDPYVLTESECKDREMCILYARALRQNLILLNNSIMKDAHHYRDASEKVKQLNDYAQERYTMLRQSIFVNGGRNYFYILSRLPLYWQMMQRDFTDKYMPLGGPGVQSEWRGPIVLSVSVFMLFYIAVASLLAYVIMRIIPWVVKKIAPKTAQKFEERIKEKVINKEEFAYKRNGLTMALGIIIFAIVITIIRQFLHRNLFIMAADLMIDLAWLMEAIFVSLIIHLKGKEIKAGFTIYTPFITMAFLVIIFRIILIPNSIINLFYPPLLVLFVIWQIKVQSKCKSLLPVSDALYSAISLLAMITGCVCSFVGYTMLAVQIMLWWTFQLTFIQTITCIYDLLKMYEDRVLIRKILPSQKSQTLTPTEEKARIKRMRHGDFFTSTWAYDLIIMALVPIMAVASILLSTYMAADLFDMSSIIEDMFFYNFIDAEGVVQISLFKLVVVASCFFLFRYLNYATRSYFFHWCRKVGKDDGTFNETLARNVIAIIVWGVYVVSALVLLQVPKSGVEVVAAGLATGMGFAMKDLLENFFYGISLMTGRLRVGDWIECDGVQGKVESITYQSTQIITVDGSVIAFLNAALFNKNFKNLTRNHSYELQMFTFGVAYGSNIEDIRQLLLTELEVLRGEFLQPGKELILRMADFGDNSVDLKLYAWVPVQKKYAFHGKAKEIIYNTLLKNNIEIPFPQRDVYIRHIAAPETKAEP